jgi:hypothetical protein
MLSKNDYIELLSVRLKHDLELLKYYMFRSPFDRKVEIEKLREKIQYNIHWLRMIKKYPLKVLGKKQLKECLIDRGYIL